MHASTPRDSRGFLVVEPLENDATGVYFQRPAEPAPPRSSGLPAVVRAFGTIGDAIIDGGLALRKRYVALRTETPTVRRLDVGFLFALGICLGALGMLLIA